MGIAADIAKPATVDQGDRKLALRVTAILTGLAIAVILASVYAGLFMNRTALAIESGIIEKEINRVVIKTLDEQKSVALWDEPIDRIRKRDTAWIDEEIGSYLVGTYGHDLVVILDGNGDIIFEESRSNKVHNSRNALASARLLVSEVRGGPKRKWVRRDANFQTQQGTESAMEGASKLRAAANVLRIGDQPAVVSAMTFTPTTDMRLAEKPAPVVFSVLYLTPERLKLIGDDVNVTNLHLLRGSSAEDEGLIPLRADDGARIGALDWTPQLPGKAFLAVLLPVLILVTLGGVLGGHFLIGKITILAGRQRALAKEARRLAYEDTVSGLPNRRAFQQAMEQYCSGEERPFAVALIDIDYFKEVNDTYGHETGDRLIQAVSSRLRDEIADWGMVARLGGDEFAVIGPMDEESEINLLKRKLGKLFDAPFKLGPHTVLSSASLGLCVVRERQIKPSNVLRNADTALYLAKARGRRQGVVYLPEMSNAAQTRRLIERDLQQAISTEQLYLAYQPVQSATSGTLDEVEALVRWRHPQLGDLSPDVFVPIAEQSNLIVSLGQCVFRMVLKQMAIWPHLHVSVNISPRELRSNEFIRFVRNSCLEFGIPPGRITFEITEGVAIDNSGKVNLILLSLRSIGFRIALDDFGTGFASLSFLRTYPLDRIKLDRSLLSGTGVENAATAVFEGAVSIGRKLGVEVVAEGIESEEQLELVRAAGCTHVQGYLLSSPLSPREVERYYNIVQQGSASQRFAGRKA